MAARKWVSMRVDVERDYLHHRYQIMVAIPDDELVAMDPTAYDLVRRSILATERLAVRDMVAILQIAAEWLQRHPEAQHAAETVVGEPISEPPLAGTAETIDELTAQLAGTVSCGYCGKQAASVEHLHGCAIALGIDIALGSHRATEPTNAEADEIVNSGPASIPGMRFLYPEEEDTFTEPRSMDPKESRARVRWLDRLLKRRARP
jgi:hypothetical protein